MRAHARTTSSLANCFLEKTWLVQRSSHGQKPCGMKAVAAISLFQLRGGCGYGPHMDRDPGAADSAGRWQDQPLGGRIILRVAGSALRYPQQWLQMLILAEDHTAMHAPTATHRHALIHWQALPCTRPSACTAMHARTGMHSMASILLMQSGPQPSPPLQTGLHWQIMTSSSSCTLRLRCANTLSRSSCTTTGMRPRAWLLRSCG